MEFKTLDQYTKPEQDALRTDICPQAPDAKINLYLRVCAAHKMDPFVKFFYLQKRTAQGKERWSVELGVDGARNRAAATGDYAGSDEPEYDSEEADFPKWCKVTVWRKVGKDRHAFTAKCRWGEFKAAPPNDFMWKTKPYHMLAKVAEMQALRKAFPEAVPAAGEDEEAQVVNEDAAPAQEQADTQKRAAIAIQFSNAVAAFSAHGKTEKDLLAKLGLLDKSLISEENLETLRLWYDELQREKQ